MITFEDPQCNCMWTNPSKKSRLPLYFGNFWNVSPSLSVRLILLDYPKHKKEQDSIQHCRAGRQRKPDVEFWSINK